MRHGTWDMRYDIWDMRLTKNETHKNIYYKMRYSTWEINIGRETFCKFVTWDMRLTKNETWIWDMRHFVNLLHETWESMVKWVIIGLAISKHGEISCNLW